MSGREDAQWQRVQDEAWSEYLYPRSAVGDLSDPNPHGGFMRAARVFERWSWVLATRELAAVVRDLEALRADGGEIDELTAKWRTRASALRGEGQER